MATKEFTREQLDVLNDLHIQAQSLRVEENAVKIVRGYFEDEICKAVDAGLTQEEIARVVNSAGKHFKRQRVGQILNERKKDG